jgi:hypothetical protein
MDTKNIRVDMVDMKDAMNDEGAEIMGGDSEKEASVTDLDIVSLTDNIIDILDYLDNPDVKKICAKDDSVIRMALINKYADSVPLKFIDLFMDKDEKRKADSVDRALKWFKSLAKVKAGEADLEEIAQTLTHEVNNTFVYSKYGGKEAFEAALKKELSTEKNKDSKSKAKGF